MATDNGDDGDPSDKTADDGSRLCGVPNASGGTCSHAVPNGVCPIHGDVQDRRDLINGEADPSDKTPDGHGSGDPTANGNRSAESGPDPEAPPEGNKRAMKSGLYAAERDPIGTFDHFRENQPAVAESIRRWFWSYMDDAPFEAYTGDYDREKPPVADVIDVDAHTDHQQPDADTEPSGVAHGAPRQSRAPDAPAVDVKRLTGKAHRLLIVCVHQAITDAVTRRQAESKLTQDVERYSDQGQMYIEEEELPVNLPKSRLRQKDLRELRMLGVIGDTEGESTTTNEQAWINAAERMADAPDGSDQNAPEVTDS